MSAIYSRKDLLILFGLSPAELPDGWAIAPGDVAVPPSKRTVRAFQAATGRNMDGSEING